MLKAQNPGESSVEIFPGINETALDNVFAGTLQTGRKSFRSILQINDGTATKYQQQGQ